MDGQLVIMALYCILRIQSAIQKIKEDPDIHISPIPGNKQVVITFPGRTYIYSIQVLELNGQIVYSLNLNRDCISQTVDVAELGGGMYILIIHTNRGMKRKKILIR